MFALLAVGLAAPPADYPTAILRNDQLGFRVTVRLPDPKAGFYRGPRFDWAGQVGPVEVGNRRVFLPWRDGHDPAGPDDVLGPAVEFGTADPPGYADAKPGETFLKIGVGALVKPDAEPYRGDRAYPVKYPGEWQVADGPREVEFRQELLAKSGHGYRYLKRLVLAEAAPQLTVAHELTNIGTTGLDTDVAQHLFFNVSAAAVAVGQPPAGPVAPAPIDRTYTLGFRFTPTAPEPRDRFRDWLTLAGRSVRFDKSPDAGPLVAAELKGPGGTAEDNWVNLGHQPSGLTLTADGTLPADRCRLAVGRGCIDPELVGRVRLKPGESRKWTVTYLFRGNGMYR